MTRTHRRTRRHPDKWKQRARMRQMARSWNNTQVLVLDEGTLARFAQAWNLTMGRVSEAFVELGRSTAVTLAAIADSFAAIQDSYVTDEPET